MTILRSKIRDNNYCIDEDNARSQLRNSGMTVHYPLAWLLTSGATGFSELEEKNIKHEYPTRIDGCKSKDEYDSSPLQFISAKTRGRAN